ncbi:MAG: hypothetical protein IJB27_04795 [Clostridia bacterium]|nr:hypothetical protein [Clostridia bacterium]
MLFILYVVLALAVLGVLPYIVFAVKRLCLAARLRAVCRKKGYTLTPLKRFWWLDTVKSGSPACKIETADIGYAVKIIGTVFRRKHLRFYDGTHYAVRSLRFETHMTAKAAGYTYKEKEPYRFSKVETENTVYPVILLHPAPTTISAKRADSNGEKAATPSYLTPKTDPPLRDELLQNGDFTGEGYVYTADAFLSHL